MCHTMNKVPQALYVDDGPTPEEIIELMRAYGALVYRAKNDEGETDFGHIKIVFPEKWKVRPSVENLTCKKVVYVDDDHGNLVLTFKMQDNLLIRNALP